MNYAVYEEILTRRMITFGVLFGAATLVFALIVFCKIMYIRKKNKETGRWNIKRKLGFSGFFGIAMMCVSLGLGTKYTLECHYDIQNQAYIVWNGDFVMEHTGKSFFL